MFRTCLRQCLELVFAVPVVLAARAVPIPLADDDSYVGEESRFISVSLKELPKATLCHIGLSVIEAVLARKPFAQPTKAQSHDEMGILRPSLKCACFMSPM